MAELSKCSTIYCALIQRMLEALNAIYIAAGLIITGAHGCRALFRLMAYRFNVVTIRIDDKGPVVIRMINLPYTRRTIVFSACCQRRLIKLIDLFPVVSGKSNMHRQLRRITFSDPELRVPVFSKAGPPFNFHELYNTQWLKCFGKKFYARFRG